MSALKTIATKKINNITYELKHWPEDNKYVVYKRDNAIYEIHRIPEVASFDTEEEARKYLDGLY